MWNMLFCVASNTNSIIATDTGETETITAKSQEEVLQYLPTPSPWTLDSAKTYKEMEFPVILGAHNGMHLLFSAEQV